MNSRMADSALVNYWLNISNPVETQKFIHLRLMQISTEELYLAGLRISVFKCLVATILKRYFGWIVKNCKKARKTALLQIKRNYVG